MSSDPTFTDKTERREGHSARPQLRTPRASGVAAEPLECLDREIAFYRRRSGQVYFFGLLVEGLILAGRENVTLSPEWVVGQAIIYSLLFFGVAAIGIVLGSEYRRRIHIPKDSRLELLESAGYVNVYPVANQQVVSEIRILYVILVFLPTSGIAITWFNVYQFQAIFWCYLVVTVSGIIGLLWQVLRRRHSREVLTGLRSRENPQR